MKYTLLKMVQLIASAMDSDEVNDISDSVESLQIVDIIETVFNEFASDYGFPEHHDFFQLEATSSSTPTVLTRPTNMVDLDWFRYNYRLTAETNDNYNVLQIVTLHDFINRMDGLDVDQSNVISYNLVTSNNQNFPIKVQTDRMPTYFMVLNDYYIVCDSYHSDEETNLQKSNTWCYGQLEPTFTRSNTFVPPFDEKTFSTFFNECKAQCIADLKQTINARLENKVRKGKVRIQKNKRAIPTTRDRVHSFDNFGRK